MLATAGGLGLAPWAPGTFGTLAGVAIYLALFFALPTGIPSAATALVRDPPLAIGLTVALLASSVLSIQLGRWSERYWGRKDAGNFVMDEVAGILLTILIFRLPSPWLTLAWTFPVTRFFDILKPPPAKQLEKLPHGWGILLDDLSSSIYAGATLHLAAYLLPSLFGR